MDKFFHETFKTILFYLLLFIALNASAQQVDTVLLLSSCQLHLKIYTGGSSAILFESGGGLDASQWDSIAMVVHHRTQATVITYDRAGFGKSSMDTANYSILQEIKNLETALQALDYSKAEMLLVGHSLGGFYNRVFAARHPKQVKGIVLLEPRIPSYEDMRFARDYFQTLHRKDFEGDYMSLYHVLANMERNSDYVRQVEWPRNIPILDIMAEHGPFTGPAENERFKADQRRLVGEYKNRRLLMAKGSSHNIPNDRPGLVIEQVVEFYTKSLD